MKVSSTKSRCTVTAFRFLMLMYELISPDNMEGFVIFLVVDTHDKHGRISAGCRDDDSLGTTLQVSLQNVF